MFTQVILRRFMMALTTRPVAVFSGLAHRGPPSPACQAATYHNTKSTLPPVKETHHNPELFLNAKQTEPQANTISNDLKKCRTGKEFVDYARKQGAKIVRKKNMTKVSKNGVSTSFRNINRNKELSPIDRKEKIKAFQKMGIAWD